MDTVLKIGFTRGGGMGDGLNQTGFCAAIKRRFPNSKITLIAYPAYDFYYNNPYIDEVIRTDVKTFREKLSKYEKDFDIFYEVHYAAKVSFSPRVLEYEEIREYKKETDEKFKKYGYLFYDFTDKIDSMNEFNKFFGEVMLDSAALSGDMAKDMFINLDPYEHWRNPHKDRAYVTLCNTARLGFYTKCFPPKTFEKIANMLRRRGLFPVQVGQSEDYPIPTVTKALDYTNLYHTAKIIKDAQFNISIEGGLVHLAEIVGTKSIVLFGSTPVGVFGYKNNINIRDSDCPPCWWQTRDWHLKCPKTGKSISPDYFPPCTANLRLEKVEKAIDSMIKLVKVEDEKQTVETDEISPDNPQYQEVSNKLNGIVEVGLKNR